jgi:hypothetical protein
VLFVTILVANIVANASKIVANNILVTNDKLKKTIFLLVNEDNRITAIFKVFFFFFP